MEKEPPKKIIPPIFDDSEITLKAKQKKLKEFMESNKDMENDPKKFIPTHLDDSKITLKAKRKRLQEFMESKKEEDIYIPVAALPDEQKKQLLETIEKAYMDVDRENKSVLRMFYYWGEYYKAIELAEPHRSQRLGGLMTQMEAEFQIPMLNDPEFNEKNHTVMECYLTISEARNL